MTTEVQSTVESTPTPVAKTISDPSLSFAEYETLRSGGKLEAEPHRDSAPPADKAAAEQKKSATSEPAETETNESHTEPTEGKDSSPESEPADEDGKEKGKKKGGFQRRIDKLNARNTQTAQELEYWKNLALQKGAGETKPDHKVETKPVQSTEGKPKADDYATHAEWVEALADWKADQKIEAKLKERDQKAEKSKIESEQAAKGTAYAERLKEFKAKTPDFEEVEANVTEALEDAGMQVSPVLGSIFLNKANGPELAYELAKDPKEFIRVNRLSPLDAAIEIGNLQARIASRASANPGHEKKTTSAPKPIEPVSGGKASAGKKTPEEMSFSEYEAYRRAQMKRRA